MSRCVLIDESGYVRQSAQSELECTTYLLVTPSEVMQQDLSLDAGSIGTAFGWGFGAVLLCYSIAYSAGVAVRVIRSI